MGLDMYLYARKFFWTDWENPKNNRQEDGFKVSQIDLSAAYWRKHPNLHGYIVQTFAKGVDECQEIELAPEQVEQIIAAVKAKQLPHTGGFFFGSSSDEDDAPTIEQLEKALAWVKTEEKGVSRLLVYRASW